MTCEELLAALGDYVDDELDLGLCEAFRRHLSDCHPCEVVVDNVRQTITLYRRGQPVELPAELHGHLWQMLRARWEAEFPPLES
jgi:hypothetical protein